MMGKKPWKKVLYETQGYPDSYTDNKIFLRDMKKNIDIKKVTFLEAVFGANLILQEFCTVVGFVLIYLYLVNDWIEPSVVLNSTSALTITGFVFYMLYFAKEIKEKLGHDLRVVLTFIVFGQLFSPVLYTLTDTISTDTIYTMVFFSLVVHLIFFDYGVSSAVVSNSLSLSAAVFASTCLASRLPSAHHAFILMTVATETFVLFPLLRNELQSTYFISALLLLGDAYFLFQVSKVLTGLFIGAFVFINVICPTLFVKYQNYKENIYGPWDEAVVDDADNMIYNMQ